MVMLATASPNPQHCPIPFALSLRMKYQQPRHPPFDFNLIQLAFNPIHINWVYIPSFGCWYHRSNKCKINRVK